MKYAVLGAGAMGSLVGACLAEAGKEVFLVGRQKHIDIVKKKGLSIKGVRGDKKVKIDGGTDVSQIPFTPDVYIVTVKSAANAEILESVKNQVTDDTLFLSFQNGISIDELSSHGSKGVMLAAVTGWAATFDAPGEISHTSDGGFIVGGDTAAISSAVSDKIEVMAEDLKAFSDVQITDNIYGHLWIKLLISSLYPVLAVCGMTFGEVINNSKVKKILFRIWTEGYHVATSLGINIETYLGMLEPEMLVVNSVPDFVMGSYVLDVMLKDRRAHKPSVLQDLEKGRITEVPYLNGAVLKYAQQFDKDLPMSRAVVQMIHEIEEGKRKISKGNLNILQKALIFGLDKAGLAV